MKKLSISIFIDHNIMEHWKYSLIENINASDYVDKVTIINIDDKFKQWNESIYPQSTLPRLIKKKILGVEYDALKAMNIEDIFIDIKMLSSIHTLQDDIIINLSSSMIERNIALSAKYGIWRFFFGEKNNRSSVNIGKYEYMQQQGYIETGIIAEHFENKSVLLHEKKSGMDHISLRSSIENVLWGCTLFIPMLINRLALYGKDNFIKDKQIIVPEKEKNKEDKKVNSIDYYLTTIKRYARQAVFRYGFDSRWMLLFSHTEKNSKHDIKYPPIHTYNRLSPPRGMFWADPFVVNKDDESYIFFEELSYTDWKGYISYIKMNKDKTFTQPKKVLQKDYHLSYPFIFQYQNEYYMIPESAENRTIELYKCKNFPEQWEFQRNIMQDVRACDTTLIQYNGRWWMFSVMSAHDKCMNTEDLYLFYSDDPLSNDWTAHQNNPVVSDATNARPAGKLFTSEGKLYRPSQSCAAIYGKGLNINEIIELSTTNYKEKKIHEDCAEWSSRIEGLHTYNSDGQLSVSDIFSY